MSNSPATLPDPNSEESLDDGLPVCKNCGAPHPGGGVAICRKCGYYELLNRVVDIDPAWDYDAEAPPAQEPVSHLSVWLGLIPAWGWALAGCVLVVVSESVAALFLTEAASPERTLWSVSQFFVGAFAVFVVHILAYLTAVMGSADYKILDIILRPVQCWLPTFDGLPKTFWKLAVGASGATAVLMSVLVIGGLPYEVLWNWGVKPAPKTNLIGAVIDQAKKAGGPEKSMEEAMDDLVGKQDPKKEPKPEPRSKIECVIIGYTIQRDDPSQFRGLVIAAEFQGKLKVAGIVSEGIPADVRADLNRRLPAIVRTKPIVSSALSAQWVEPRLTCRVSYTTRTGNGGLNKIEFDELMGDIQLPR